MFKKDTNIEKTCTEIAKRVKELSSTDGVNVSVRQAPLSKVISSASCIDIELTFKGYAFVERFNSHMNITDEAIDCIAIELVRSLFYDYFKAKLEQLQEQANDT